MVRIINVGLFVLIVFFVAGIVLETGHKGLCQRSIAKAMDGHAKFIGTPTDSPVIELHDLNYWVLAIPPHRATQVVILQQWSDQVEATPVKSIELPARPEMQIELIDISLQAQSTLDPLVLSLATSERHMKYEVESGTIGDGDLGPYQAAAHYDLFNLVQPKNVRAFSWLQASSQTTFDNAVILQTYPITTSDGRQVAYGVLVKVDPIASRQ